MSKYNVAEYKTTEAFRRVEKHTCVADQSQRVIAVTGPIGDAEAEKYARLYAAAPDLLESLKELLREVGWEPSEKDHTGREVQRAKLDRAYLAIAKAEGKKE